jgi:hypothetical protein
VLLKALVSTENDWVEKLISSRFDLDKQIAHEISAMEGTVNAPKETYED